MISFWLKIFHLCDIITENEERYDIINTSKIISIQNEKQIKGEIIMSVLKVTTESFEQEVMNADQTVLVDFYADWCGPCKMMGPVMEEIASEREDVKVVKINVDDDMELAQKFGVMSIPTFIVFKNGQMAGRKMGANQKSDMLAMLD